MSRDQTYHSFTRARLPSPSVRYNSCHVEASILSTTTSFPSESDWVQEGRDRKLFWRRKNSMVNDQQDDRSTDSNTLSALGFRLCHPLRQQSWEDPPWHSRCHWSVSSQSTLYFFVIVSFSDDWRSASTTQKVSMQAVYSRPSVDKAGEACQSCFAACHHCHFAIRHCSPAFCLIHKSRLLIQLILRSRLSTLTTWIHFVLYLTFRSYLNYWNVWLLDSSSLKSIRINSYPRDFVSPVPLHWVRHPSRT